MNNISAQLVSEKYDPADGVVRFKYAGEYLDHGFGLTPANIIHNAPAWVPKSGFHFDLRGYWIFKPNENKCWQAVNANGRLRYWNQDGLAQGPPQDWELFIFEDAGTAKVRIRNIWDRYVNYGKAKFACTANQADAAIFEPLTQ